MAHALDPASTLADVLRCAADLGEAGAHEQALALLDHALENHPQHAPLHTARGWALENLSPARWAQARSAYEAAIALDAGDLWARLGLATVLGQTGESARCAPIYLDLIDRAEPRVGQDPEYLEMIGWCQYKLGRLNDATASFTRALAIDGDWVSVRFDLGLVLLLRGDPRAAVQHCDHALRTLAHRAPHSRTGPVQVALDDLDAALTAHPHTAAFAAPLRYRLLDALQPALADHE
jgi:tetratricopeptide (TPR) repeat protein